MNHATEAAALVSTDPPGHSPARRGGDRLVEAQARRQVRTFFDELKNGTRNYRTVASLSGQITQEYRGRCVLELLQNAHDALAGARPDDPRLISFVLASEPEPVLLIANSGRPFRLEDFEGICQLGQSPKDPNESVGNKGLGFQSVLEVSTRPQIWSTQADAGAPEFVFGFDPTGTESLVERALAEIESGHSTPHAITGGRIIDWSEEQLRDYRRRNRAGTAVDVAREARSYVSPYSIPLPIEETPPEVAALLDAGHVTVVRLRLDGGRSGTVDNAVESIEDADLAAGAAADRHRAVDEAVASIKDQLGRLDARSVVFLPDLKKLAIDIDGECRALERIVDSTAELPGSRPVREQVLVVGCSAGSPTESATREFRVWTRGLGGDGDPAEAQRIRDAVRHLPNRWPEVRQVEVAVAVEDGGSAEPGVFVIFLPTEAATGTGAHVNAPFYAKLDRRQIDLDDEYNALLLEYVTDLGLDVAVHLAAGPAEGWRGRAVIDLLASAGVPGGGDRPTLMEQTRERADEAGRSIEGAKLILCDQGWRDAQSARIMPEVDDDPLGDDRWRESAEFAVVSSELDGRRTDVEALLRCLGGDADPKAPEWAATIERLAARIYSGEIAVSWDVFLRSLLAVLPQELRFPSERGAVDPLSNAKFLPTQDGRLLCASHDNAARVFFQPRRGVDDAAEFVGRVPDSLRDRIAFLHDGVKTHEGPQRHNTEVQKFLDGRFVQGFRREDLLREVVIPALPDLPICHTAPDATVCAEILAWTLALIGRDESDTIMALLKRLPVACRAGWFAAGEAVFGPGWPGRLGERIQSLADGLPAGASRLLDKALLPPSNALWNCDIAARSDLFERAGVVDGLRLDAIEPLRFSMSGSDRELPIDAPGATPQARWDEWKETAQDELQSGRMYGGSFPYSLSEVRLMPEIHRLDELTGEASKALSDLVLASLAQWPSDWHAVTVRKRSGHGWATKLRSPLSHWLATLAWLDDNELEPRPLCQRWFVPESLLRGQGGRFAHLAPLSLELAHRLGENPDLLATLERLGLNVYPTEDDRTGPALLEALADAQQKNEMPAGGFDVFLGQVRHAWRHLAPDGELPERFLVRTATRTLEIRTPSELADVYLPDHNTRTRSLRDHRKPILEMRPAEAQGTAGDRLKALDLRRASNLGERCLVDGKPLDDATAGALPIEDTELHWLPLVLLTLAAHGGANPRGPATDAWRNAMGRIRKALVRRCGSLAVELMDADKVVAHGEPRAHWLPQQGVLLLGHEAEYEDLASASQAILERQDLLKDLRLVLGSLAGAAPKPTGQQIEAALDRAEIDGEAVADVRHRWFGATTLLVDRIQPVLKLLGPPGAGLEAAAGDTRALEAWLKAHLPERHARCWAPEELIRAARRSGDDLEMGREAFRRLGEDAQLPAWNNALAELGDRYVKVKNDDAADQAQRHINEAAPYLRALARHLAIETKRPNLFRKLEEVVENFEAPNDWSDQWWEVPFNAVLGELRSTYVDEVALDSGLVDALDDVTTAAALREALAQRGIALDVDPYETFRQNESRLGKEIHRVRDLHRAWLGILGADSVPPRGRASGSAQLDPSAYLRDWSEAEIFGQALETVDDLAFRKKCDGCRAVNEVRVKLGVTPEVAEQVRRKRLESQRQAERANRTFSIAGKPFEVDGPESYGDLLAHLDTLPELKGPSVKSDESTRLVNPGPGPAPSPGPAPLSPGRTSHLYSSPYLPVHVGIVGEMHAYRYLRSQFGNEVVTPAAWVSENGEKVLPPARGEKRDASDSHGFDFRFVSDGITWHFEVKATTGDDTSFSLPRSEIRAATDLATSRRDRWRILRIRLAFSDTPQVDLLPNPFETGFSNLFRLSRGGLTVRYALDADT